jgi:hypothetical protein
MATKAKRPTGGGPRTPVVSAAVAPNLLLWGVAGLGLSLAIAFAFPHLTAVQATVVAALLGLSGAAIATANFGILRVKTKMIVASGPFAVFILFFYAMMQAGAPGVLPDPPMLPKGPWNTGGPQ